MAAFLDGNLSVDEMGQISEIINGNKMLRQMVVSSDVIDEELKEYMSEENMLPGDIADPDLEIPEVEDSSWRHLGKVGMVAAAISHIDYQKSMMERIKDLFSDLEDKMS